MCAKISVFFVSTIIIKMIVRRQKLSVLNLNPFIQLLKSPGIKNLIKELLLILLTKLDYFPLIDYITPL